MSGPQPDEPNYFVLIAPGADSDDPTPAWTDVSTDLRSVSIRRGADKHLDEDQPGEATIVLDNFSGRYDNDNTASPYAGQLVTDMRVRVLAEWDGDLYERFNGYLDDIDLEYPDEDAEAWAVLRCTDAFKVLAGTDLAPSAYAQEVLADGPVAWWRFDEEGGSVAHDAIGDLDLTATVPPELGTDTLISRDPGASMTIDGPTEGVYRTGAYPVTGGPLTIEAVVKLTTETSVVIAGAASQALGSGFDLIGDETFGFEVARSPGVATSAPSTVDYTDGATHHVVGVWNADNSLKIYVDGADRTSGSPSLAIGAFAPAAGFTFVGGFPLVGGALGVYDEVAIYDYALSPARIAAHADAVSTPWDGDSPGERVHRVLDLIGWPDLLRDIDDGASTLQSAETAGQTALDHLLKVAASEFGELHVSKEGAIQLRSRHSLINRDPLAEFGPDADQVRYRTVRFSSGADLIRNPVTVSRLDGLAQTAEAAASYYPHQFTIDGLYHDSDTLSRAAAEFLLSEFKDQKRRIAGLTFGPFEGERLYDWFPLLLEAELGNVYQVTFRPPNGDDLVQVSVLEGTEESWAADTGIGELSWSLSRAYAGGGAFWQLGVVGRSELGDTTRLYL